MGSPGQFWLAGPSARPACRPRPRCAAADLHRLRRAEPARWYAAQNPPAGTPPRARARRTTLPHRCPPTSAAQNSAVTSMSAGEQRCHIEVRRTALRRTALPHRCSGDSRPGALPARRTAGAPCRDRPCRDRPCRVAPCRDRPCRRALPGSALPGRALPGPALPARLAGTGPAGSRQRAVRPGGPPGWPPGNGLGRDGGGARGEAARHPWPGSAGPGSALAALSRGPTSRA